MLDSLPRNFSVNGANGGGRTHMAVNRWNLNAIKGLA